MNKKTVRIEIELGSDDFDMLKKEASEAGMTVEKLIVRNITMSQACKRARKRLPPIRTLKSLKDVTVGTIF